jgi:hypothetical protein
MTTWHYVEAGAPVGPLTMDEMKTAINDGKITPSTKVWSGEGEWTHASETLLAELFIIPDSTTPPPLAGEDVDNTFMWILVTIPLVSSLLDLALATTLIFPAILANIALCVVDERKLKKAGHKAPVNWAVFIVPIYLWKRAELLNHKKYYFSAWVLVFALSIMLDINNVQGVLADSACPVVTDIIKEQLYGTAKCMKVNIDSEVTTGFYKATAILDNGNELYITIEEQDDGMIYVQIPDQ